MKTTQFEMVFHIDMFAAILVESPFLAQNHCARWSTMKTNAGWRDGISSVYLFCMKNVCGFDQQTWMKHDEAIQVLWLVNTSICMFMLLYDVIWHVLSQPCIWFDGLPGKMAGISMEIPKLSLVAMEAMIRLSGWGVDVPLPKWIDYIDLYSHIIAIYSHI